MTDTDQLTGRMAVVTGAGSGIGRAVAQLLAQRGAAVAVIDLDPTLAEETAALIREAGGRAAKYQADVSRAPELDAAPLDPLEYTSDTVPREMTEMPIPRQS